MKANRVEELAQEIVMNAIHKMDAIQVHDTNQLTDELISRNKQLETLFNKNDRLTEGLESLIDNVTACQKDKFKEISTNNLRISTNNAKEIIKSINNK